MRGGGEFDTRSEFKGGKMGSIFRAREEINGINFTVNTV